MRVCTVHRATIMSTGVFAASSSQGADLAVSKTNLNEVNFSRIVSVPPGLGICQRKVNWDGYMEITVLRQFLALVTASSCLIWASKSEEEGPGDGWFGGGPRG